MKKNRLSVVALILLLAVITLVHAQDQKPPNPEEIATRMTEWMKINLNLNEDQVGQVKDVNLKYAKRNLDLKESSMGKRQQLETLRSNDAAKEKELKNILTPDQYKTWQVKKQETKENVKENHKKNKT